MKVFEVRCHEWGDNSDYHWENCDSLESALKVLKDFYNKDPLNIYEHLYIIEIAEDGTKSIPEYNRDTFELT